MGTQIQEWLEGKIDFEGQKLVEQIVRHVLISLTILSFIVGFVTQSLTMTFGVLTVGTLGLAAVVLPAWPMFKRHPVKWLRVRGSKKER